MNNEVGNEKLHAALIHEDRETIKGGLIEMISKVIEEKKDSSYLETDMKKREKNNEKARKAMENVPSQKNPHFEEVSTLRQGWTNAYASIYEKKLDPVGQEDGDIDNDGDKDSSDKYLSKRRKAIGKAMKEEGEIRYPTEPKKKFSKDKNDPGVAAGRKAAKEMGLKHNEGFMPMNKAKVDSQKKKAYDKDQAAQSKGDTKEADKQFKRRMAMDFQTKMKKEEVSFSEAELKAFEEIVNSWID